MKVRTGFVSNSSSGSFVLITTPANYFQAFNKLDDKQKLLLDPFRPTTRILGDRDVVIMTERHCEETQHINGRDTYDIIHVNNPDLNLDEVWDKMDELKMTIYALRKHIKKADKDLFIDIESDI
jgi:hypothetical protein